MKRCRIRSGVIDEESPDCSPDKERKLCWRLVVLVVLDRCADLGGVECRQPAGVKEEESGIGSRVKEERPDWQSGKLPRKQGK